MKIPAQSTPETSPSLPPGDYGKVGFYVGLFLSASIGVFVLNGLMQSDLVLDFIVGGACGAVGGLVGRYLGRRWKKSR